MRNLSLLHKTVLSIGLLLLLVRFEPPVFAQHRGGGHGGGAPAGRSASGAAPPRVAQGVAGPHGVGGFYRPYYAFTPRVSVGFGLWMGYPIAYPYAYYSPFYSYGYYGSPSAYAPSAYAPYAYAPYGNGYPYANIPYGYGGRSYPSGPHGYGHSYPTYPSTLIYPPSAYRSAPPPQPEPQASIDVQAGTATTGGLSFDITPTSAQVFVDGSYVGTVGQFTSTSQPLGVDAGRHRVEIREPGYRAVSIDVDIIAGQVVPYQGTMER